MTFFARAVEAHAASSLRDASDIAWKVVRVGEFAETLRAHRFGRRARGPLGTFSPRSEPPGEPNWGRSDAGDRVMIRVIGNTPGMARRRAIADRSDSAERREGVYVGA